MIQEENLKRLQIAEIDAETAKKNWENLQT